MNSGFRFNLLYLLNYIKVSRFHSCIAIFMPGHQNYAQSPMCGKHDIVNCWDCDKRMKQKNINAHYKYEIMKNDPEHVGKESHYYKPSQRSFSFNFVKLMVVADTEEKAEMPKEQVENLQKEVKNPAEHEVQVKVEKLIGSMKKPSKKVKKPEIKVEKPEEQEKIKSENQEEEQPEIQN